jgi:preprotein translocase subunit SecA
MVGWILKKILGSKNQREVRRMAPIVRQINELEGTFQSFSDDELHGLTASWKEDLAKLPTPEEQWKRLDEILPEAFAVVKNAARRLTERGHTFTVCDQPMKWEMVHFDVQLIGGVVLHRGFPESIPNLIFWSNLWESVARCTIFPKGVRCRPSRESRHGWLIAP